MKHLLKTVLPYLPEYHWYRRLIGGHWERRAHVGPVVPGGPNELQTHWGHTDECWRDAEVFNGKHGVWIEQCEEHGEVAVALAEPWASSLRETNNDE